MVAATLLATTFHEKAETLLSALNFALENDPAETHGPYVATSAHYTSPQGFCLAVGFDPFDGGCATIRCGRKWHYAFKTLADPESSEVSSYHRLSNYYWALAAHFGFDLPRAYTFSSSEEAETAIDTLIDDLKATLPDILERATLADLEEIERGEFGQRCIEERQHRRDGPGPILVRIDTFPKVE